MFMDLSQRADYALLPPFPPNTHTHTHFTCNQGGYMRITERDAASERPGRWGKDREEIFMDQRWKEQDSDDISGAQQWAVIRDQVAPAHDCLSLHAPSLCKPPAI